MLPILRIIPVGGVFLAVLIVVLALDPPGGAPPAITRSRAPLVVAEDHPEWRQFLIQAAVRRADEVSRLRDLPATPTRTQIPVEPETTKSEIDKGKGEPGKNSVKIPAKDTVAGLPSSRSDSEPDDLTGTISDTPGATIPVDIGETSRFELPVAVPEEKSPAAKPPQQKPPVESNKKPVDAQKTVAKKPQRVAHRAKPTAKPQADTQPNALTGLFGDADQRYQPTGPQQSAPRSAASQRQ